MKIRKATKDDLAAVQTVEHEIYGSGGFNHFYFRQMLDLFGDLLWIAENRDGRVVGYALGAVGKPKASGWVVSLAVVDEFRGQGIAAGLSRALLNELQSWPCREVRLTVSPNNCAAINLYRRLGFEEAGRESDYFGPDEPRVVMSLSFV